MGSVKVHYRVATPIPGIQYSQAEVMAEFQKEVSKDSEFETVKDWFLERLSGVVKELQNEVVTKVSNILQEQEAKIKELENKLVQAREAYMEQKSELDKLKG